MPWEHTGQCPRTVKGRWGHAESCQVPPHPTPHKTSLCAQGSTLQAHLWNYRWASGALLHLTQQAVRLSIGSGLQSVSQFSPSVVSDSLQPHESQHARPPCPSPTPRVHSNSCPSSQWCHLAISSSVVPFSSCPQSLPASGSFSMSQLFAWDGQSIGVSASASVLPVNTQDWSPLGWTGWISLQRSCISHSKQSDSL